MDKPQEVGTQGAPEPFFSLSSLSLFAAVSYTHLDVYKRQKHKFKIRLKLIDSVLFQEKAELVFFRFDKLNKLKEGEFYNEGIKL